MTQQKLIDELTQEFISTAEGTCMSRHEVLPYLFNYETKEFLEKFKKLKDAEFDDLNQTDIDDAIFLCSNCGWWYAAELVEDDWACTECHEESKEEEND